MGWARQVDQHRPFFRIDKLGRIDKWARIDQWTRIDQWLRIYH